MTGPKNPATRRAEQAMRFLVAERHKTAIYSVVKRMLELLPHNLAHRIQKPEDEDDGNAKRKSAKLFCWVPVMSRCFGVATGNDKC